MRETPGQVRALRQAVECGDAATLATVAHSLKGSSALLGATVLAARAAALQEVGDAGMLEGVTAGVDALAREFERVQAALEGVRREAALR